MSEQRRGENRRPAPVGVAVLGYGHWGRNHARVFDELPSSRLVAIADENLDRLQASRAHPHARPALTLEELLTDDEVEAVVVCTPATTHAHLTRQALAAGRHVLVEKPFTTVADEGDELVALAAASELTLMVGHTFLFNIGVRTLVDLVWSEEIGPLHYLYARRTNLGPIRRDVNALWDLATHDISIFNHLMGASPLWVSAVGSRVLGSNLEDVGFISLGYPNGVLAHIHCSWSEPSKVREIVVVGSRERVVFNDLNPREIVRIDERGVEAVHGGEAMGGATDIRLHVRDGATRVPRLTKSEPLRAEGAHFIECVETGRSPLSGGKEGTDVVRVMEAVDASVASGGAPMSVQRALRALQAVTA